MSSFFFLRYLIRLAIGLNSISTTLNTFIVMESNLHRSKFDVNRFPREARLSLCRSVNPLKMNLADVFENKIQQNGLARNGKKHTEINARN